MTCSGLGVPRVDRPRHENRVAHPQRRGRMRTMVIVLYLAALPMAVSAQVAPGGKVIVTGRTATGTSQVVQQAPAVNAIEFANSRLRLLQVWGTTPGAQAPPPGAPPMPSMETFLPSPGGSRLVLVELPTTAEDASSMTNAAAVEAFQRDFIAKVPDLAAAHGDAQNPAMHRTVTVDYVFVMKGSIELELDNGTRVPLGAGDIVIQNSTNHAWHNVGAERAILAAVMIGVQQ